MFGGLIATPKGGLELLASATANNSATVDFTSFINSVYDEYVIAGVGIRPATDNVSFWARVYDGAWQADAADYSYGTQAIYPTGSAGGGGSASDSKIVLANTAHDGVDNTTAQHNLNFELSFFKPSGTSYYKQLHWELGYNGNAAGAITRKLGIGQYHSANAITGIRFLFSSGNISVGDFYLFGVRKN